MSTVSVPIIKVDSVGIPYIGTNYILSCVISVSQYVDTNISISSNWSLSSGPITSSHIITNSTEETENKQVTDLMFNPLRRDDNGSYTCTAGIEGGTSFVLGNRGSMNAPIVVKGTFSCKINKKLLLTIYTLCIFFRTASS